MLLIITKLTWTLSALALLVSCGGTVNPSRALSIDTTSLPDGMAAFDYSAAIHATGGTEPLAWVVSSGSLPNNLTLETASTHTVKISGVPGNSQSTTFTVQVKDVKNQTAVHAYSINIKSTALAQLQPVSGQVLPGVVEVQGVSAGMFNPVSWQQNTLNWVPDVRMPMFAAQSTGPYQNIYAPWPLEQPDGWRMFYGGWDGTNTPFDQIYGTSTTDFLSFGARDHIISNGDFLNVNNVNVQQLPDGSLDMICTGGQAGNLDTFPVYFSSPDGKSWNGMPEPYPTRQSDIIYIQGYAGFSTGNFNGANVLLRDGGTWVLYFKDWNDFHTTYRATAVTLPNFQFQGAVLKSDDLVNDVKKFTVGNTTWYLMGLHFNGELIRYSLSNDGVSFAPEQILFQHLSAQDLYMVALGFVTQEGKVLGVLYGASAVASLDRNEIFARWLQKKIVLADSSGNPFALQGSYGPDRQQFTIPAGPLQGNIWVYAEDGVTPLASGQVQLAAGQSYQLNIH
jgi:hypothetical protein